MNDLLWRACFDVARRRLGANATVDDLIWSTATAYLFATGQLAESNASAALH